jgi:predicted permease
MRWHERLRFRLRGLFAREQLEDELDEELRFHLDAQIAEYVRGGMDPAAARREAQRLFGGVEKVKEECRDQRRVGFLEDLMQDVGYGVRALGNAPGFAAVAILTLALGIGANTAIFSVVHGVLLAPLPYPEGERLLLVEARPFERTYGGQLSILEFAALREEVDALDLVEHHGMSFTLFGHGYPKTVEAGVVSASFFDVLGVTAALGRTFVDADERPDAEAVLVISHEFWRDELDADRHVVGELFEMNDRPHRIIGVLPPIPHYPATRDVYMPTTACPFRTAAMARLEAGDYEHPYEAFRNLHVFGRLRAGGTAAQARDQIAALPELLRDRDPGLYRGFGLVFEAPSLHDALTARARPMVWTLAATVALVLLIACANVANLMLSRVLRRRNELALRAAMGAGRGRLLRQLLAESTVLSLLGGGLGVLFAAAGLDMLVAFIGRYTTRTADIQIDLPVLAFTFVVAVATGVGFGILPGLSSRLGISSALHEGGGDAATPGRAARRLRGVLIAGQVALSFMLLIGAGLLINSLYKLTRVDAGFANENLLTARVATNWTRYRHDEVNVLFADLLAAIEQGPGVISAAVSNAIPFAGGAGIPSDFLVSGAAEGSPIRLWPIGISSAYFETLGVALLEGRMIRDDEFAARTPVALLSRSARLRYWPEGSPLGARVAIPNHEGLRTWHTVVGVVADARYQGLASAAPDVLYAPYTSFGGAGQVLVRTSAEPEVMTAFIREAAARVAPQQAVEDFRTFAALRSGYLALPRQITALIGMFAGLALLITVAGIGGIVAFSVSQRSHEIGIRMALGARRNAVVGMVLRQGLSMALAGLAIGVAGAWWSAPLLAPLLFETEPGDPLTFAAAAAVLVAATLVACLLPARRATAIDPVVALRVE